MGENKLFQISNLDDAPSFSAINTMSLCALIYCNVVNHQVLSRTRGCHYNCR